SVSKGSSNPIINRSNQRPPNAQQKKKGVNTNSRRVERTNDRGGIQKPNNNRKPRNDKQELYNSDEQYDNAPLPKGLIRCIASRFKLENSRKVSFYLPNLDFELRMKRTTFEYKEKVLGFKPFSDNDLNFFNKHEMR